MNLRQYIAETLESNPMKRISRVMNVLQGRTAQLADTKKFPIGSKQRDRILRQIYRGEVKGIAVGNKAAIGDRYKEIVDMRRGQ